MMKPELALGIWFYVLLILLGINVIVAVVVTTIKRRGNTVAQGLDRLKRTAGGIAMYLPYDSPLLELYGFTAEFDADNIVEKLRQTQPWLIDAALSCGFFVGSEQEFYILGFFGAEDEKDPADRHELFKISLIRLLEHVFPFNKEIRFELEFVSCLPDVSFLDLCRNTQCTHDLQHYIATWCPDDIDFEKPRLHDAEVESAT